MRTENTLLLLFCGSLLTPKLNDAITGISKRLPQDARGKTWEIFSGTGTEGNMLDSLSGLFHGGIGKNNCYKMSFTAEAWVRKRYAKDPSISTTLVMIGYGHGTITASRTACLLLGLTNLKVHLIDLDSVAGIFADTRMVLPISENVASHTRFHAAYSAVFLFPFLLTHLPGYSTNKTKQLAFVTPMDHRGTNGTEITIEKDIELFFLKSHSTLQPLWVELMCHALLKIGFTINTTLTETTLIDQFKKIEDHWQKKSWHISNYARNLAFDESIWSRFPLLAAMTLYAYTQISMPYAIAPLAFIAYITYRTIALIGKSLTPVACLGKPLSKNIHHFLNYFDTKEAPEKGENLQRLAH